MANPKDDVSEEEGRIENILNGFSDLPSVNTSDEAEAAEEEEKALHDAKEAAKRAEEMAMASKAAAFIPGVGPAASVGMDVAAQAAKDKAEADEAKAKKKAAEAEAKEAEEKEKREEKEAKAKEKKENASSGSYDPPNVRGTIKRGGEALWDSKAMNKNITGTQIAFWLMFALHITDISMGYSRVGTNAVFWFGFYAVVTAGATFFTVIKNRDNGVFSKKTIETFVTYLVVSALAYVLPVLLDQINNVVPIKNNVWFVFFLMLSGPWPLFLLFNPEYQDDLGGIQKGYLIIWIGLALLMFGGMATQIGVVPPELQGEFGFNPWETVKIVAQEVWDSIKSIFLNIIGLGPLATGFFTTNLNDSLGTQYRGQVDPYSAQGLQLGVNFDRMRTGSSGTFREGQPVVVWTDITGESFRDKINLSLRCYATNRAAGGDVYEGKVISGQYTNPQSIQFDNLLPLSAQCRFDNLPKGSYDVTMAGVYNFVTWAYIQYYFAPYDLLTSMEEQNLDPAYEAGIDKKPLALYNDGPAMLGISSEWDQPLAVYIKEGSENEKTELETLPTFGATLSNANVNGEVRSVRTIILSVPPGFVLYQCDRPGVNGDNVNPTFVVDEVTGYHDYSFPGVADIYNNFESVTCFMKFKSKEFADKLVESYDLVRKTFGAKTAYLYEVKKTLPVVVE